MAAGVRLVAGVAMAAVAFACGTSGDGGSSEGASGDGNETASGAASGGGTELGGTLHGADDLQLREVELEAGEAIRAVVRPEAPLQAGLILFGPAPPIDFGFEETVRSVTFYVDYEDTSSLEHLFPATPLMSSTHLAGGCTDGGPEWLYLVAPVAGTYYLGVVRDHGAIRGLREPEEASGEYTVVFETRKLPDEDPIPGREPFDTSSSDALTESLYWEAQELHRDFELDPAFFPPEDFTFPESGPYASRSCSLDYYGPPDLDPAR